MGVDALDLCLDAFVAAGGGDGPQGSATATSVGEGGSNIEVEGYEDAALEALDVDAIAAAHEQSRAQREAKSKKKQQESSGRATASGAVLAAANALRLIGAPRPKARGSGNKLSAEELAFEAAAVAKVG